VGLFSKLKTRSGDLPLQTSESGFHSGLFWHSTTEKHQSGPVRLPGNAYLVDRIVHVIHIYAKENEEQSSSFAGRIFKE